MIRKVPKPRKRPYWASKEVWERTTALVTVPLFGHHYELPLTERTTPIFALLDGSLDPWKDVKGRRSDFKRRNLAEDGLRDIINAVYAQIEAVAVADASSMMAQDIRDQLQPLIQKKLHERVDQKKVALTFNKPEEKEREAQG